MATKNEAVMEQTHRALRAMLANYDGKGVTASPDEPGNYVLIGPPNEASR